jgi:hypothetical protein
VQREKGESNEATTDFTDGTDEDARSRLPSEHSIPNGLCFSFLSVASAKSVVAFLFFGRVERDVSKSFCLFFVFFVCFVVNSSHSKNNRRKAGEPRGGVSPLPWHLGRSGAMNASEKPLELSR